MKAADETPAISVDRRASVEAAIGKESWAMAEKGSSFEGATLLSLG